MEYSIAIKDIDFGKIDGKEEAKKDNFNSLFYHRDDEYQKLLHNDEFIICGRKGVGKTLLVNYLNHISKSNKEVNINLLDVNDFIKEKLRIFNYQNIKKEEMDSFWEYIFLIEFMKQSLGELSSYDKIFYLDKFIRLKHELNNANFILSELSTEEQTDQSGEIGLGAKSVSFSGKGFISKKIIKKYERSKYYQRLEQANKVLFKKSIFEKLIGKFKENKKRHFIIYDDIDELYDKVSDRDFFIDIINSMIRTANRFNIKNNKVGGFKLILVLREDIVNELQYHSSNLNKIMGSSSINLNWIDSRKDINNPLIKMVIHKIKKTEAINILEYSDEEVYSHFLSQESGENNLVELLIERTFGRPRDIIKFLQIYQKNYPNDNKFLIKNLKHCYKEYSKWFYDEMCNEIHILNEKKQIELTIKAIQEMKKRRFSFDELKGFVESSEEFKGNEIKNLKDCVNTLYSLGFIGNTSKGRSKITEFSYRLNHSSNANFKMDFIVHFGMQSYLSL